MTENGPAGRGRRWRGAGLAGCAVLLAGPAVLTVVRLLGWDDGTWWALPMAGLPYAAVLCVVVLAVAVGLRGRWVGGVAAALVALQLWWLVPRFLPDGGAPPAGAPRLRVATSNNFMGQVSPKALVDLVREQRIDVLAVEEQSDSAAAALDAAGIRELLPHRERPEGTDSALYTRLPVGSAADPAWPTANLTVDVGGHPVQLVAVHTYYPLGDARRWADDLHRLRAAAPGRTRDAVLLGDFNATLDHAPMRDLLDTGLADTHEELGAGLFPTWPEHHPDFRGVPPVIQIDHVLHGSALAAVAVSEHALARSDHRAVVAELAVVG
ncbi:endonuclease/exonuclease/phosphatase family protein [Kitasatospora cineracea]|uniref:Endonuclease/exonuclease/phosphatase (EEP) superfamily protein YafD n=1 Tax=Kitasatospora cineracea TaxID=88074 RepID=A0A8G1ULK8_9ACTN|nr:endonuclease/exonuclease/phosphatase family protein [Kitasatospora cineracea]ROR46186.1 endonuclease/exonuclease/phosphatase (EEP) superfamily protein YafD [Kitasatospora cineracea]